MTSATKTRREKFKLKPKEIRLIWMVATATALIVLVELYVGLTAFQP